MNCYDDSLRYNRGKFFLKKAPLFSFSPNYYFLTPFFFSITQEIISEEIVDETDQFEDNRTKVVASRSANSTMMKGFVYFTILLTRKKRLDNILIWKKKKKNRIVELRRPIDTSLLGRIHSITESFVDGRTTTSSAATTTTTYRDNPHNDSAVDLTLSTMNGAPGSSRRLR